MSLVVRDTRSAVSSVGRHKRVQRTHWNEAAEGWRCHWPAFEQAVAPVNEALVGLARIDAGHRVLDVATGVGEPALTLARRVGPSGRVVATDVSPAMLAVAAERVRSTGICNVELAEMDAEDPWLPRASFDAAFCRFGLMFLADLRGALGRLAALLVPGGRLAAAVWAPPEANPVIALTVGAVVAHLGSPPAAASSLGADGVLEAELTSVGFTDVESVGVNVRFDWESPAAFVRCQQATNAPLRRLCAAHTPERRASLWAALDRAAASAAGSDGKLRLPGKVVVVAAKR